MLFKPTIGDQYSGSIGGLTAAHNAGGTYFRRRSLPTNPGTSQQTDVRNALGGLAARWSGTLTDAQRDAWTVYAANVPLTNRIGEVRTVSGLAHYIRSNTPRIQSGLTIVDDGPTDFTLPSLNSSGLGAVLTATGQTADVFFDDAQAWADEAGAALLWYMSRPQNPTINFFKGPYQYAGLIEGDSVTAPTSPVAFPDPPFAVAAGQRVFSRFRLSLADGRLSTSVRTSSIALA